MFLSWKLDKFNLFTHSLIGWNLENLYKHAVPIFSFDRLSWHFKRENPFLESTFINLVPRALFPDQSQEKAPGDEVARVLQNKNLLHVH